MGLDVTLVRRAREEANEEYERLYEEYHATHPYPTDGTDAEKKAYFAAQKQVIGDVDYSHEDIDSLHKPDHMFKRNYLRSSYNAGGFNQVVQDLLETGGNNYDYGSLYWIFEPIGADLDREDDWGWKDSGDIPALEECMGRAIEIGTKLQLCESPFRVTSISVGNPFNTEIPMMGEQAALAWFRRKYADLEDSFRNYSNKEGHMYGDGMQIYAAVPGIGTFKEPCVHLIYKQAYEDVQWYTDCAYITAEFCEQAIEWIKKDGKVYISWSG